MEGRLLPLAYPVLGFLLLLPRGNHGSLQLQDTWGMHVATHGDPHPKQGPWSGSKLMGLYQLVAIHPTPRCLTGVRGAVTAGGANAVGCHQVKAGWEVV